VQDDVWTSTLPCISQRFLEAPALHGHMRTGRGASKLGNFVSQMCNLLATSPLLFLHFLFQFSQLPPYSVSTGFVQTCLRHSTGVKTSLDFQVVLERALTVFLQPSVLIVNAPVTTPHRCLLGAVQRWGQKYGLPFLV
jgi:hypothetical protein